MKHVPVLGLATGCGGIVFFLAQHLDLKPLEKRIDGGAIVKGHAGPAGPTVAGTIELAGDPPAWIERTGNAPPNGVKVAWRHQRQGETAVDQIAARPLGRFEGRDLTG